jgi:VanZ family protein
MNIFKKIFEGFENNIIQPTNSKIGNFDNLDAFNKLISASLKQMECDPECQRLKKEEELKNNYELMKENTIRAPYKEEEALRNYMVFTQGESEYNEYQLKQYETKASELATETQTIFNTEINDVTSRIDSYYNLLFNYKNVNELYNKYKEDNKILFNKLKNISSDIVTNNRKTYYEDQKIDTLRIVYYILVVIYFIGGIIYIISLFIYPSTKSWIINFIALFIIILYPFYSLKLFIKLNELYNYLVSLLPKNVYTQK